MTTFKEGMICFSSPTKRSFIQKAISFFTGSTFTHSFIVIKGPMNILCALETTETRVCLTPVERKYDEDAIIECYTIRDETEKNLMIERSAIVFKIYSGEWYSYLSYIWFMYRYFARLLGHEPKTMWRWCANHITCTELTAKSLSKNYKPEQQDDTISPEVLNKFIIHNKELFDFHGWIVGRSIGA